MDFSSFQNSYISLLKACMQYSSLLESDRDWKKNLSDYASKFIDAVGPESKYTKEKRQQIVNIFKETVQTNLNTPCSIYFTRKLVTVEGGTLNIDKDFIVSSNCVIFHEKSPSLQFAISKIFEDVQKSKDEEIKQNKINIENKKPTESKFAVCGLLMWISLFHVVYHSWMYDDDKPAIKANADLCVSYYNNAVNSAKQASSSNPFDMIRNMMENGNLKSTVGEMFEKFDKQYNIKGQMSNILDNLQKTSGIPLDGIKEALTEEGGMEKLATQAANMVRDPSSMVKLANDNKEGIEKILKSTFIQETQDDGETD